MDSSETSNIENMMIFVSTTVLESMNKISFIIIFIVFRYSLVNVPPEN